MGLFRASIIIAIIYFMYIYFMKLKRHRILKKLGINEKYLLYIMLLVIILFELLF